MTGTETILVVDDEEAIVNSMADFLRDFGYRVVAMESSLEALSEFRLAPEDFDLVITDMTMPFLSGVELAGKMLEIREDIPVILCTGFDVEASAFPGITKVFLKPMDLVELVKEMRIIFDTI